MGPSIASGSQVWSGSWADFANAPTSSRRQAATSVPSFELNASPAPLEHRQEVERADLVEDQERRDDEADVADHVDDERLDAGCHGRAAAVPVRDQEVRGRADERPPDDQDHEVRRQDQQQHREDEVVQVGEVARVAAVARHVRDRVEVDQERDAADDEAHEHRQRVDQDREVHLEVRRGRVGPEAVDELAVVVGMVEQVDAARRSRPGTPGRSPHVAIQPGSRPGSTRQPSEMTSVPASGKASTSQP